MTERVARFSSEIVEEQTARISDREVWALLQSLPAEARGLQHKPTQYYFSTFFRQSPAPDQLHLLPSHPFDLTIQIPADAASTVRRFIAEAMGSIRQEMFNRAVAMHLIALSKQLETEHAKRLDLLHRLESIEALWSGSRQRTAVDMIRVRDVVTGLAEHLQLKASVSVDADSGRISIIVPPEQEDRLAEHTLEFYGRIRDELGVEVLRSVEFDFDVSD